ncbi:MAG: hypothetical protein ACKO1M_05885 [Planctomycetota bacterium]
MDYKLHRPQPVCHRTGRGFAVGEEFFSALVRGESGLERFDVAAEAWDGPPPNAVAWWRARQADAADAGPVLAPVEVLLDALEALADNPVDDPLRYLLALQLVRRRALRIEGEAADQDAADGAIVFSCRRRERDYRLRPVRAEEAAAPEVAARLMALLWSGEAA